MRVFKGALLACALVTTAAAQSPEPPIADARLTVHTLLREDIFAGFFDANAARVARAERNIALMLQQRPAEQANLLAWKGSIAIQRAVYAWEGGKADEFTRYFTEARDTFASAAKLSNGKDAVAAITGGSFAFFGDRLPPEHRAEAWSQAYKAYSALWKQQEAQVDGLPVHLKGELLSGMAQSAQRMGHTEESAQFVDRMLTSLAGTPFEKTARQWRTDPTSVASTNLTCKNCHAPGRLSAKLAALNQ
jgi:hypothetical protein